MQTYTAKEITAELLQAYPQINLRTVRYYTQIGIVPPLELSGNKRVYTSKHLHYFRAVLTLAKTGETLAAIQEKLRPLPLEEIIRVGNQISVVDSGQVLQNETHRVSEDVYITLGPRVSAELRQRVIESVSKLVNGGDRT
ncbi:MerR family transcriptional regulator [Paenibacillus mucilaginosus 3016]|uniref:MerR family transcriptional regulator n=1 Tax=Paenibacillus mucilaginosus 3016 TaxID=1116391 RepID=H6NLR6_9BACL|nr:MerR family transcriptional regulator [Paenibacillus mucilaginosus]AFC31631.1 MerR family transcriptional regulator [Paenibacillus mucilaginosus 3016]WFA20166.1 MerR family transcriptional regulator [Paenibacillus mucilaginosus]